MKVICAGAPKTGTKSVAAALRMLGYDNVYDIEEAVEFGFKQWDDIYSGRTKDLRDVITKVYSKNVDAVVDFPHSYFFDHFLEEWPKAKVILMMREIDDWYRSYETMVNKAMKKYFLIKLFYYLSPSSRRLMNWFWGMSKTTIGTIEPREVLWKSWYKRHNSYVKSVVPPSQLLVYRVEEGWEPLCKFLDKEVPNTPFPCENQASSHHNITDRLLQDTWIAKKMALEIKILCVLFLVITMSALYILYSGCLR